jgi:hypothetical protein
VVNVCVSLRPGRLNVCKISSNVLVVAVLSVLRLVMIVVLSLLRLPLTMVVMTAVVVCLESKSESENIPSEHPNLTMSVAQRKTMTSPLSAVVLIISVTGEVGVVRSCISILAGSGLEDGVGDTSLADKVLLRGLHLSAAEDDTAFSICLNLDRYPLWRG